MSAPERIWVDPKTETTLAGSQVGTYWNERHRFAKVEFVRADLHTDLLADRERLAAALHAQTVDRDRHRDETIRLAARVEELREALRPFAQMPIRNGTQVVCDVTPDHVAAARAALQGD